jgi:hypothetical protein
VSGEVSGNPRERASLDDGPHGLRLECLGNDRTPNPPMSRGYKENSTSSSSRSTPQARGTIRRRRISMVDRSRSSTAAIKTTRARREGTTDQGCSNSGSARRPTKGLAQSAYRVAQSDGLPVQTRKAAGILVAAIRRITGQGSGKVTSVGRQGIIVGGHFGGVGCPESSLACCVQCETRGPRHQWPNLEINF